MLEPHLHTLAGRNVAAQRFNSAQIADLERGAGGWTPVSEQERRRKKKAFRSPRTKSRASAARSSASAPRSGICRPTVRTSLPLSSASRSSKPSCVPPAVDPPRPFGLSSAPVCRTSAPRNAAIAFDTAAIRAPHGHEKRFSTTRVSALAGHNVAAQRFNSAQIADLERGAGGWTPVSEQERRRKKKAFR